MLTIGVCQWVWIKLFGCKEFPAALQKQPLAFRQECSVAGVRKMRKAWRVELCYVSLQELIAAARRVSCWTTFVTSLYKALGLLLNLANHKHCDVSADSQNKLLTSAQFAYMTAVSLSWLIHI